jgi:hypothetical protein
MYRSCRVLDLNVDKGELTIKSEDDILTTLTFPPFFGFTNLRSFESFDIAVDQSGNICYTHPPLPTMSSRMIQMDKIIPNSGSIDKGCICFEIDGYAISMLDNAWNNHVLSSQIDPCTMLTLTKVLGFNIITDLNFPSVNSAVIYRNVVSITFRGDIQIMYTVDGNCVCTRMNDSYGYLRLAEQGLNLFLHPINITILPNSQVVGIRISWIQIVNHDQLPRFESFANILHYDNGYIFFEWNESHRIILIPQPIPNVRLPKEVIEFIIDPSTPKDYGSFLKLGYEMHTYPLLI